MKKFLVSAVILLALVCPSSAWSDWRSYKTDNFTVFYKPGLEKEAWSAIQALEKYKEKVWQLAGNKVRHTNIVIQDAGDLVNGYTDVAVNSIHLYTKKPGEGELRLNQHWDSTLNVHEYTHMSEITNVSGLFKVLTDVFGRTFYPNLIFPLWGLEGIAVYSESNYSPYSGRLNDAFFEAHVLSRAKEDNFPSIEEATFMPIDYPWQGGAYIYGSEFYKYLSEKYGEGSLTKFFGYYGGSIPLIEIGTTARAAFGKNFPHLWEDWKEEAKAKAKEFKIDGQRFTNHGWIVCNPVLYENKLYFARGYPVKTSAFSTFWFSQIIEKDIDSGKESVIASSAPFKGVLSRVMVGAVLKVKSGVLYFSEEDKMPGYENESYGGKGIVYLIHSRDLKTGESRKLFEDEIRDLEVLDSGDIVYSKDLKDTFGSQLVRFDRKKGTFSVLMDTDHLVDSIVAKDDKLYVSARKDNDNFGLYEIDVKSKKITELVQTEYFEGGQSLSGDKIYFGSNFSGRNNLYTYDLSSKVVLKVSDGGYEEHPVYSHKKDEMYFIGLTGAGYDIYKGTPVPEKAELPKEKAPEKTDFPLKKDDVKDGNYSDNLSSMLVPYLRIPMMTFDGSFAQSGLFFMGQDAIGNFPYKASMLYDSGRQKLLVNTSLSTNYFSPVIASIGYQDYDTSQISAQAVYPLIDRTAMGLSSFNLGLYGSSFSNFSRKMVEPFLSAGFRLPNTILNLSAGVMIERQKLGSSISRTGGIGRMDVSAYFLHNECDISAVAVTDPDNPSTVFPVIRGYNTALADKTGVIAATQLGRQLLKIRQGWWRYGLYFEDLCGFLFADAASSTAGNSQISTGAELHLEVKTVVNVDLGVRYSYNKENQSGWAVLIKAYTPFNINMDNSPRPSTSLGAPLSYKERGRGELF